MIITTDAFLVDVGLQDIPGTVGVVLQIRQATDQVLTALMDEERGLDAGVGIAETLEDSGPAGDAVRVSWLQIQAQVAVLFGDGTAVAFGAEHVGARDEAGERAGLEAVPKEFPLSGRGGVLGEEACAQMVLAGVDVVAGEHGFDRLSVALRNPVAFGVLVQDIEIALMIKAAQQHHREVGMARIGPGFGRAPRKRLGVEGAESLG